MMRKRIDKSAKIVLTITAAAFILACWDLYQAQLVVRAAGRQEVTIAERESAIASLPLQPNSSASTPEESD
jgi:hypothetical protein